MDDRLKETLSAMLDDQADELSVRRVLSHPEQDKVRSQWQRWQAVRDLMHDSVAVDHIDVSVGVRQSLSGVHSPSLVNPAPVRRGAERRWYWSAAAMVFAGLLVGFGVGSGWESGRDGTPMLAESTVKGASDVLESADVAPVPEVALQGLDQQQWEHLSHYLLEHAQHNSVAAGRGAVGYARLASVSAAAY
ncbi:sigma-E factor negative regulatory protein [Marinobacter mobilis]|uniref:Sigma-E factor negative regulatory protein RseA n=1 Tax=Marinobacter mobilis TaxID=488533 RepID=A0A1H3A4F6_9GAMM|nr:sigma-E factor negative regulatory protein [Marinobacter mobilis]SDX24094.1 sigma-E factor negative regulatory protein RseA [Marinobacter mobilis]